MARSPLTKVSVRRLGWEEPGGGVWGGAGGAVGSWSFVVCGRAINDEPSTMNQSVAKRGREETDPLRIINYRTDPDKRGFVYDRNL